MSKASAVENMRFNLKMAISLREKRPIESRIKTARLKVTKTMSKRIMLLKFFGLF